MHVVNTKLGRIFIQINWQSAEIHCTNFIQGYTYMYNVLVSIHIIINNLKQSAKNATSKCSIIIPSIHEKCQQVTWNPLLHMHRWLLK